MRGAVAWTTHYSHSLSYIRLIRRDLLPVPVLSHTKAWSLVIARSCVESILATSGNTISVRKALLGTFMFEKCEKNTVTSNLGF